MPKGFETITTHPKSLVIEDMTEEVNYGDKVVVMDLRTGEQFEVPVESYYQHEFMAPMEKILIGKKEGTRFNLNDFEYEILKILK
ncbi:hypothetical protein [Brevibacillus choshinensis]|uniref:Uncharacterized protein n=1 Tax=Brevibacillus choshinensis TaxID=54911 RepID=A0ABX7FIE7_BRECH|nr:hypothetical protein [Brevibacillus choshinensis]QRG66003.1 hypothetical protein JNE38_20820 [Brevibacillus choshinensis]